MTIIHMFPLFLGCNESPATRSPSDPSISGSATASGNQFGESGTTTVPHCTGRLRILSGAALMAGDGFEEPILDLLGAERDELGYEPVDVGDLDNDGVHELVFGVGGGLRVLPSSAIGGPIDPYALPAIEPSGSSEVRVVAAGDLTGDGVPEVIAHPWYGTARIYDGAGLLAGGPPIVELTVDGDLLLSRVIALGDIDGDGIADLALNRQLRDTGDLDTALFRGPVTTDWSLAAPDTTLADRWVASLGDVNQDGIDDVAAYANDGDLSVFDGTVLAGAIVTPNLATWTLSGWGLPTMVGDVDGDGVADLGAKSRVALEVFSGTALSGRAMGSSDLVLERRSRSATGDFDGDGQPELALATLTALELYDDLVLDGSAAVPRWSLPIEPTAYLPSVVVTLGDVDGDGAIDLALGEPSVDCPEMPPWTGATL